MSHLQRFAMSLPAVVALIATVALAVAPASGQEGVKVFVIANDMVNDEDKEERWQIQVTARPVGGCVPSKGQAAYSSPWIDTGAELGVELSLGECVFRISVAMRQESDPVDCWYTTQLTWDPDDGTGPADNHVFTSDRPEGVSRLSAVRKSTSHCAYPSEMRFYVDGRDLVEDLPSPSADADLLALALRAAEIAAFDVRLEPDRSEGPVPAGCDRTGSMTVHGDARRVRHSLQSTGGQCRFQASITQADAPFEPVRDSVVVFSGDARIVNLTSLVRLPQARIAIIQNVTGSTNKGTASYTIDRSCGRHGVTSPPATLASTSLQDGRYTVHAPHAPSFGATVIYPAVADGPGGDTIVGCSVTVSLQDLPTACVVNGGPSQSLTWTEAEPIRAFDFEFYIRCGPAATGGTPPTTAAPPTATPTTTTTAAALPTEATEMVEVSEQEPEPDVGTTAQESSDGPPIDMMTG